MASPVVFLDACVLYPPLVRGIILGAAEAGLFIPRWSERVLGEWRLAAARDGGLAGEDLAAAVAAAMAARFPGACVTPRPGADAAIDLPDPADAHVLAAAMAAGAGVLLTFNLRDFPARRLAAHGIAPRHPDGFLWQFLSEAPEILDRIIRARAAQVDATTQADIRRALKRARLSRLGKAWAAMATGAS